MQPVLPRYEKLTIHVPESKENDIIMSSSGNSTTSPLSPAPKYYPISNFNTDQGREGLRLQLMAILKMMDSVESESE